MVKKLKTDFKIIEDKRLNEKVYYTHHKSGLDIYIEPKQGYSSQYAIFGTKYGSIDNQFMVDGEKLTVPHGIAHYLEHKLFESEDGDAFSRFAKTGASANAYTSFDRTCYLFSSTTKFEESLEILLDFVQHPYFTKETVQKEQGIIGQEIKMYEDAPDWRVLFNLLSALYHTHPVAIDIAGTVETISHITPELLYKCYETFYNLSNMVLCVAGDVDPETIIDIADKTLKPSKEQTVSSLFDEEPNTIVKSRVEQKLSVSIPLFDIGFKDIPKEGEEGAKDEALTEILLEACFGDSSDLYQKLYNSSLINSDFSTEFFSGRSFSSVIIGGSSHNPDEVLKEVLNEIEHIKKDGLSKDDFESAKRAVYGRYTSSYDSVDNVANNLAGCRFMGIKPFDAVEAVANADYESAKKRFETLFDKNRCAMSVILPID